MSSLSSLRCWDSLAWGVRPLYLEAEPNRFRLMVDDCCSTTTRASPRSRITCEVNATFGNKPRASSAIGRRAPRPVRVEQAAALDSGGSACFGEGPIWGFIVVCTSSPGEQKRGGSILMPNAPQLHVGFKADTYCACGRNKEPTPHGDAPIGDSLHQAFNRKSWVQNWRALAERRQSKPYIWAIGQCNDRRTGRSRRRVALQAQLRQRPPATELPCARDIGSAESAPPKRDCLANVHPQRCQRAARCSCTRALTARHTPHQVVCRRGMRCQRQPSPAADGQGCWRLGQAVQVRVRRQGASASAAPCGRVETGRRREQS
eukprot:scaffold45907_cov42-Tisochrysis_lutea.AAC.3